MEQITTLSCKPTKDGTGRSQRHTDDTRSPRMRLRQGARYWDVKLAKGGKFLQNFSL